MPKARRKLANINKETLGGSNLTIRKGTDPKAEKELRTLTNRREAPFAIAFEEKLDPRYNFFNLQVSEINSFQRFLDKVLGRPMEEVEKRLRRPDHNDKFNGKQIQHYEVTEKFRIHGYYNNAHFVVLRMDPNHKVHHG